MLLALTTTGKVALLVVAGTFIVFALVTAIVIPSRRPSFPGDRLGAYIAVVGLLFVAQMATVVWVAETQETEAAETETAPETEPGETEPTETEPGATQPGEQGDAAAGKQVFASAGCGGCHTLQAAGSNGTVGPNLDDAMPSFDLAVERVTNGMGVMPSFKDRLSDQQIRDVAAFVSESAGGS